MNRLLSAVVLFGAVWGFHHVAVAQNTADYEVTFLSTWSASTHPDGFPPNPHFSGLIGATHDSTVTFWVRDRLASPGIKNMAETGSKVPLRNEVEAAIQQGSAEMVLDGGGISPSPGLRRLTFSISEAHPLVTLVSMLAPSPDWFVGVSGLNLRADGRWVDTLTVDLFAYDAGTDGGTTYTAPNQVTNPPEGIARIETMPFLVNAEVPPVARFRFIRQNIVAVEEETPNVPATHVLSAAYPNPFTPQTTFTLSVGHSQHVRIDLFDLAGRRVETLFDGFITTGTTHRFDMDAEGLPSGTYVYRVVGEQFSDSRTAVLVR